MHGALFFQNTGVGCKVPNFDDVKAQSKYYHPITTDTTHKYCCCQCPIHSNLGSTTTGTEWSPGIISRALVYGLGYTIADTIRESNHGLVLAIGMLCVIFINEFCYSVLQTMVKSNNTSQSKYFSSLLLRIEKVMILTRYFSVTAIAYSSNSLLKLLFSNTSDVLGILSMLIMIYTITIAIDTIVP